MEIMVVERDNFLDFCVQKDNGKFFEYGSFIVSKNSNIEEICNQILSGEMSIKFSYYSKNMFSDHLVKYQDYYLVEDTLYGYLVKPRAS